VTDLGVRLERIMTDIFLLTLGFGLFALLGAYVLACDRA